MADDLAHQAQRAVDVALRDLLRDVAQHLDPWHDEDPESLRTRVMKMLRLLDARIREKP